MTAVRPNGMAAYRLARRFRDRAFAELIRRDFAAFGAGTRLHPPVQVWGEDRIWLGNHVRVGEDSWLQALGGTGRITIGDGTRMSGHDVISAVRGVHIGRSVLIARGVYIADHGHGRDDPSAPIVDQPLTDVAEVHIGDGAWLGHNVVVLPGVRIGAGAILAANAVVRTDVPPRAIVGGVPARLLTQMELAQ